MEKELTKKPVVLLCWGYSRIGWIEIFERINEHFEFVYLFYYSKELEENSFTGNRKVYYNEFAGPRQIINSIKPAKIVFMGYDSPLTIALNVYAKKKGIVTFFMMHGTVSLSLEDYRVRTASSVNPKRNFFPKIKKLQQWLFTFKFLVAGTGLKHINIVFQVLRYRNDFPKYKTLVEVFFKHKYAWRFPTKYIVYCRQDVDYYVQQDNAAVSDIYVIGNVECEPFFDYQAKALRGAQEDYILYLETPLAPIAAFPNDRGVISKERYNELLKEMNVYALSKGFRLMIKLHPYNYEEPGYFEHENIIYLRDTDKIELIMQSRAVIGYDSSLLVTSCYFKMCCFLIKDRPNSFQEKIIKIGYPFVDIDKAETFPDFFNNEPTGKQKLQIKHDFLDSDKNLFPATNISSENLVLVLKS